MLPTLFSWEEVEKQLLISSHQCPVLGHKGKLKTGHSVQIGEYQENLQLKGGQVLEKAL